jgi:hypothetical protein
MKNKKLIIFLVAIGLIGIVLVIALKNGKFQKEIVISKAEIQEILDKNFPIEKNLGFAKINLESPSVYFENENIGIRLNYSGSIFKKSASGAVDMNSQIIYRQDKGAFYLSNFNIDEIAINDASFADKEKIKTTVSNVLSYYLDDYPIYTLKQRDFKQNLAKLLLKDVRVQGDALVLTMGI